MKTNPSSVVHVSSVHPWTDNRIRYTECVRGAHVVGAGEFVYYEPRCAALISYSDHKDLATIMEAIE